MFSFFSGSGFLDLGFEENGFDIEFVDEFSKPFLHAYEYSRKKMGIKPPKYGYWPCDINDYLGKRKNELADFVSEAKKNSSAVGFIGGPPCPDFSVAGKNKGRNGDNGKLSLSYVNLIKEMLPDFFLFENVKGLWRTVRHRAFYEELKKSLGDSGYVLTERLTNALEFGVPQDRDRILLFGVRKGLFGIDGLKDFGWTEFASYDLTTVKSAPWPQEADFIENSQIDCPAGVPKKLTVQYWFGKNDVENHPNSGDYFTPRAGLVRMKEIKEGDISRKSYKRLARWKYSPTAAYGNNEVHLHPYKIRRISVSEALAIQSMPKEFSLPDDMTLSDMFKTVGNGVPFLLSSGVAKAIKYYLTRKEKCKN